MGNTTGLHRNANQKVIAGVCSGLAESLKIDTVIVRLIFVLLAVVVGGGIFIYIVLWIVLPEVPAYYAPFEADKTDNAGQTNTESVEKEASFNTMNEAANNKKSKRQLILGIVFIGIGAVLLLPGFFDNIHFADLWPIALIILGVVLPRPSLK